MQVDRSVFYPPEEIFDAVESQLKLAEDNNERVDYLTFVPDGEPTLDINLGEEIDLVKSLGKKIAVIQNSSLLWVEDVRNSLLKADWVSLKVDAVDQRTWRLVNRPHKDLKVKYVLDGIKEFASQFKGELATETMVIHDSNDNTKELAEIANFLKDVKPDKAYISIPTRPPAEKFVKAAEEAVINQAYQVFSERLERVEYLIGFEGDAFAYTGDVEKDLLSITSVHPMREESVDNLLSKADSGWRVIEKLLKENKLIELEYRDKKFYMRKISSRE
jgi:wyosine [tRNA(Phe)-imidazoG37] synthetase (radical SAM superfamily)